MTPVLRDIMIDNVIKAGGGCTALEYNAVIRHLALINKPNLLVFSLGHDSPLWQQFSDKVTFLEDSQLWLNKIKQQYKIDGIKVSYNTQFLDSMRYIKEPELMHTAPFYFLKKEQFDAVFIDGPAGYGNGPGRTIPIKVASELTGIKQIYIHDYNRLVEKESADAFMIKRNLFKLKEVVGKMGIFYAV
jgi:hypothetical protein